VEKIDAGHFNQIGWWDSGEAITGVDREGFEKNSLNIPGDPKGSKRLFLIEF